MMMQRHVLERLHFYWLPRYLASCKNIGESEKSLMRKVRDYVCIQY